MNFKIRIELQAEETEAELWIDVYNDLVIFTDSNGIEYKMCRQDVDVFTQLLKKDLTK